MVSRRVQKLWAFGLILLFFAGWEFFCLASGMSDLILPRPSQVFRTLWLRLPILWPHILQTLATTLLGFALGVALGVALGALIGVSRTAYDTVYPLLIGFSSIPKVAVVSDLRSLVRLRDRAGRPHGARDLLFPHRGQCGDGLATTEPELEDVLRALGASKGDILWNVGLPRTMPFFFASLKVAVTYAFVGTVLSETVASNRGIATS